MSKLLRKQVFDARNNRHYRSCRSFNCVIHYESMKTFEKQFNIKTKLETLDQYIWSILNKVDPDDEIEVNIQEFDGKKIVNVKILDRVLN